MAATDRETPSICPECESGVHVACRDEPGTSAECACPCGETPSAATAPPRELIDPDGEGIYLHEDQGFPGVLMRAALLFFGDMRKWQDVEQRTVYMRPGEDDHWVATGIGRWPYGWKLNLPKRVFPVEVFVYCTPKPEAL